MKDLLLVPLSLPDSDTLLPWLGARLGAAFGLCHRIDATAMDMAASHHERRDQVESRSLLAALGRRADDGWVLGVTSRDLFIPIFTFVIGEADLGGRAAVVSTFRLCEDVMGRPAPRELVRARLLKQAVHELGHCLGLLHCSDDRCVMRASANAEEVDAKSDDLCLDCLRWLRSQRERPMR